MRNQRKRQRGAVIAEFVLSAMLFLLLVFGVIEFAFAMFQWTRVVDATRAGARAAIVNEMACGYTNEQLAASCNGGAPLPPCTGLPSDSPIMIAMNRRKLEITGDQVTVTYSCSTAGFEKRSVPVPEVKVEANWRHTFLFAGLTLGSGRKDLWSVTLPSFATTRLGEDLHTPSD